MPDEPQPSMIDALVRLSSTVRARLEVCASQEDLSMTQMRLLGILRDCELTINELAAHMSLDKSSMSGLVVRAERRGFVARARDELDQRAVRVRLEPRGRSLINAAAAEFEADMRRILATLTEGERAEWTALTTRLLTTDADERGVSLSGDKPTDQRPTQEIEASQHSTARSSSAEPETSWPEKPTRRRKRSH